MSESPRMSALKALSNKLPVANTQLQKQQAAARDIQLQQAVGGAAPAAATTQNAQQTATAQTQNAGQQVIQGAQQQVQQQGQIQQTGVQEQARQDQATVSGLQQGADQEKLDNVQKLAQIDQKAKQEMYDSRRQFAEDELGRKFTNERQLADYALLRSKSQEDWLQYQQQTDKLNQRNMQLLQAAQQKLSSQLEYENKAVNQLKDQALKKNLTAQQQAAAQKMLQEKLQLRNALAQKQYALAASLQKKQADAANRHAKNAAIGTVAGAVIGGALGSVVPGLGTVLGASVGASVGGALGGLVG